MALLSVLLLLVKHHQGLLRGRVLIMPTDGLWMVSSNTNVHQSMATRYHVKPEGASVIHLAVSKRRLFLYSRFPKVHTVV